MNGKGKNGAVLAPNDSEGSTPKGQWRMRLLIAASALAMVGLVALVVKGVGHAPPWIDAAAASPLAVRCLVLIVVGTLALGLAAALFLRMHLARGRPRFFHADQDGTAAVEMALLFPFALMIFLIITQAALLFNANMVVHYAAFAAARVATVVVPMEINEELSNLVYDPDLASNPTSEKLERIRRAAVLALVPVSASLKAGADNLDQAAAAVHAQTRSAFSGLGAADRPWFRRIESQYWYANAYTKIELAKPEHWRSGNRDEGCPYRQYRRGDWALSGWNYTAYCPFYPDRMDYGYWEDLVVRTTYAFLLEVPYASRFLGEAVTLPDRSDSSYAATIRVMVTLSNEGGPELQPEDAT